MKELKDYSDEDFLEEVERRKINDGILGVIGENAVEAWLEYEEDDFVSSCSDEALVHESGCRDLTIANADAEKLYELRVAGKDQPFYKFVDQLIYDCIGRIV